MNKKIIRDESSAVKSKRNALARFARSIHPVAVKAGRPCDSLKRHFAGYLRQFVGYVDLLARHDHERFVWAQTKDIGDHMVNAFKPPSRRTTMFCRAKARELGIIGGQHMRFRAGRMREGFIVAKHDSIMSVTGNVCCNSASNIPSGSPLNEIGSPLGSPLGSPPVLPKPDLWCTTWCTTDSPYDSENTIDITPSENFCPENVQSDSALALRTLRTQTDKPFNPLRARNYDAAFAVGIEHAPQPNPTRIRCQGCNALLTIIEWATHPCNRHTKNAG